MPILLIFHLHEPQVEFCWVHPCVFSHEMLHTSRKSICTWTKEAWVPQSTWVEKALFPRHISLTTIYFYIVPYLNVWQPKGYIETFFCMLITLDIKSFKWTYYVWRYLWNYYSIKIKRKRKKVIFLPKNFLYCLVQILFNEENI